MLGILRDDGTIICQSEESGEGGWRRLTRPDEAPVARTVLVLVDIFVFEQDMGYRQYAINVHCFE
jgi:hypothetical protein